MKRAFVLLIWFAVASCTSTQEEAGARAGRDCFNTSFVSGFSPIGRNSVRLDVGPRRSYEVDLLGAGCDQVNWAQGIVLDSSPSSWICVGDRPSQGQIRFRDPATRQRTSCFIENVRRVPETPAPAP